MRKPDGKASSAKKERADTVTGRKDELDALRESWERIGTRILSAMGLSRRLIGGRF